VRLLVAGAGGHAKVVLDAAIACGFEIAGLLGRPDGASQILGHPVFHTVDEARAEGFIAAEGDNHRRAAEFERLRAAGLAPVSVVHPTAILSERVTVGDGTFIAAGVVVNVDALIGENAILNTGCRVDHDCVIGAHAHIGPGATLCGGVRLGDGVLAGVGASFAPETGAGAWSIVGAGAAVIDRLPERMVCVGVPARAIHPAGTST
jgi:sugar O-acyltransferase (sialic acid O-acetyltransferase NeuD family)